MGMLTHVYNDRKDIELLIGTGRKKINVKLPGG